VTNPPGHYPPPPPQPYSSESGWLQAQPKNRLATLKWVLILLGVVVVVAVAAAAAVYYLVNRDSTQATQVKAGDCLGDIPDSSRVLYVHTVTCDQPHKGEVFSVLTVPDGDFPGDAAVMKYADQCKPALAKYAPSAVNDAAIKLFVLYPTSDSWQRGDRTVTCIATSENPRTGKLG
jgi:putative regulator of septum formation